MPLFRRKNQGTKDQEQVYGSQKRRTRNVGTYKPDTSSSSLNGEEAQQHVQLRNALTVLAPDLASSELSKLKKKAERDVGSGSLFVLEDGLAVSVYLQAENELAKDSVTSNIRDFLATTLPWATKAIGLARRLHDVGPAPMQATSMGDTASESAWDRAAALQAAKMHDEAKRKYYEDRDELAGFVNSYLCEYKLLEQRVNRSVALYREIASTYLEFALGCDNRPKRGGGGNRRLEVSGEILRKLHYPAVEPPELPQPLFADMTIDELIDTAYNLTIPANYKGACAR